MAEALIPPMPDVNERDIIELSSLMERPKTWIDDPRCLGRDYARPSWHSHGVWFG
jgi:hypothetical protein